MAKVVNLRAPPRGQAGVEPLVVVWVQESGGNINGSYSLRSEAQGFNSWEVFPNNKY